MVRADGGTTLMEAFQPLFGYGPTYNATATVTREPMHGGTLAHAVGSISLYQLSDYRCLYSVSSIIIILPSRLRTMLRTASFTLLGADLVRVVGLPIVIVEYDVPVGPAPHSTIVVGIPRVENTTHDDVTIGHIDAVINFNDGRINERNTFTPLTLRPGDTIDCKWTVTFT